VKIVHTSDWHVGRRWKGIERLDEMEAVLRHLGDFIEREAVDLVLHTGDLFDGRNPAGDAEQLVNAFFVRVGAAGAQMIAIAGNHDDPDRLDARALLAQFAHVHLLGRPRSAAAGGTLTLETRGGEKAVVAALPFAPVGKWVSALDLAADEAAARSQYAQMFQLAVANLIQPFRPDAVNLLMAHTHLEGAVFGESERRVHVGQEWAATPQTLPSTASYIALGHIHLPQRIGGTLPAYYAGSPIQMDLGEVGQKKAFPFVTAVAGRPARVEHIPYEGGTPLLDLRGTLTELEALADRHRHGAWLRIIAVIPKEDPELNRKVRALFPRALVVIAELPELAERPFELTDRRAAPLDRYSAFHRQEHGAEPSPELLSAFGHLHAEAEEPEP
jgi:exonuclease SbcD